VIRRVVFNADDFGASSQENRRVIDAARAGIVREASLVVTTGSMAEQAARAAESVGLGIGLHFSLTLGSPLSGPIGGFTRRDGPFHPLRRVLARSLARAVDVDAVERELRAQLARVEELGFRPTHLNGHHHAHIFPGVRTAVLRVLRDFPGLHVRVPLERPFVTASARRALITAFSSGFLVQASADHANFRRLPFVGLGLFDESDHAHGFAELARRLPTPVAEWMVHPRPEETPTLVDPKTRALLRDLEIEPSRYSDVLRS